MIKTIVICVCLALFGGAEPQGFTYPGFSQPQVAPIAQPSPFSAPLVLLPKEYYVKVAPNSPYQQFGGSAPAVATSQQYSTFSRQHLYQPTFGQVKYNSGAYPIAAAFTSQPQKPSSGRYTAKQQKEDEALQNKKNQQQQKQETEDTIQQQNNDNLSEESSARFTQSSSVDEQLLKSPVYFISQQFYSKDGQFAQFKEYDPRKVSEVTTEKAGATTTESDTTDETATETSDSNVKYSDGKSNENIKNGEGLYYLLLPDGKLQKIVYMTKEDLKKMQLSANIKYQNVDPIVGPVYSFNPSNSPYVKVL